MKVWSGWEWLKVGFNIKRSSGVCGLKQFWVIFFLKCLFEMSFWNVFLKCLCKLKDRIYDDALFASELLLLLEQLGSIYKWAAEEPENNCLSFSFLHFFSTIFPIFFLVFFLTFFVFFLSFWKNITYKVFFLTFSIFPNFARKNQRIQDPVIPLFSNYGQSLQQWYPVPSLIQENCINLEDHSRIHLFNTLM